MRMRKLMPAVLAAALTMSACGTTTAIRDPDSGAGAGANAFTVTAQEYGFTVEGTPKTGPASLQITNAGKELHHAIVGWLDEGKTLEDVKTEVLKEDSSEPPAWFHDDPIDSNLISPGRTQTLSFPLTQAATYVLLCFMPAPDGKPHVEKGMVATFEVEEAGTAKAPKADAVVSMSEYKFSTPEVKAGVRTLEFKNAGKENHDFAVVKFAEGKKPGDVDAWFQGGLKGPAPATFYGGSHDFEAGKSVFFTAELDPGTYTLFCGVQTDDGKNHGDDLGMTTTFEVH